MAPLRKSSAAERGKGVKELVSPPLKRGRGRPHKHAATDMIVPWGSGRGFSGSGRATNKRRGASPLGGGGRGRGGAGGRPAPNRPPRRQLHSSDAASEFVMWVEKPGSMWLRLRRWFRAELPEEGPDGVWLQADGCCSGAFWVGVEVLASGDVFLGHGWQSFARARRLQGKCTLHFKYDGVSSLLVKAFSEGGRRLGCCPEVDDDEEGGDDLLRGSSSSEGELSLGRPRGSPLCGSSSSSSSGGYPGRPLRHAGSPRRRGPRAAALR